MFIGRTDVEAETPILWTPDVQNQLTGKDPDVEKDRGQEKRATEDEVFGWHHLISGHECEQTPDNTEGQKSVACCSLWGHRVGHY